MKRYIRSSKSYFDIVNHIDVVIFTEDARDLSGHIPVVASNDLDEFDSFSKQELLELDTKDLRKIDTFYALDKLSELVVDNEIDYKLTAKQKSILEKGYKGYTIIDIDPSDAERVLKMVQECKHIVPPDYRINEPSKNFAEVHGYDMAPSDYVNILKQVKPEELFREVKGYNKQYFANRMFEFIHRGNNYVLKYDNNKVITDDIVIYIKIVVDYAKNAILAFVSFHDAEDEMGHM